MGRICQICSHEDRLEIDRAIIRGTAHTQIALEYGVNNQAVGSHAKNHLSRQMVTWSKIKEESHFEKLLIEIDLLLVESKEILQKAKKKKHYGTALQAIDQTRKNLAFIIKMLVTGHELQEKKKISIDLSDASDRDLERLARAVGFQYEPAKKFDPDLLDEVKDRFDESKEEEISPMRRTRPMSDYQ